MEKLVRLICGDIKRYAFVKKITDRVRTDDYFEWDELGDDAPYWTIVQPISKEEYLANSETILDELEDCIAFVEDFWEMDNIKKLGKDDIQEFDWDELCKLEHQYILDSFDQEEK